MFNPVGNAIPSRPLDLSTPDHSSVQREQPTTETSSQRSLPEVIEATFSCSSSAIQQATAVAATKKKKKKKKKGKGASTSRATDLTKIYYNVIVDPKKMGRDKCPCCTDKLCNKEIEVYRVPLSLLPHQVQAELLRRNYKEDKEIAKETAQERLRRLSMEQFDNKPVIEVTSLTPIRFTQFGKATPKAFIEKFGLSFQAYLQKNISEKFTNAPSSAEGNVSVNRTIPEGKYIVYSVKAPEINAKDLVMVYDSEDRDKVMREHKQIPNLYLAFLSDLLKWAEEKQVYPYDLNVIDTLIHLNISFIRSSSLSQQNKQILLDVLASSWIDVKKELHYFIWGTYSKSEVKKEHENFLKCKTFLKNGLLKIESFFSQNTLSKFRSEHKEEVQRFLSSLKKKNDYFINWLKLGTDIHAVSSANFYYSHFNLLQNKTLDAVSLCYQKETPLTSYIDWQKNRINFLLALLLRMQKENEALYTMTLPFVPMINRGFQENNFKLAYIYLDKIQKIIVRQVFNRDDYKEFKPYVGDIGSNSFFHEIASLIGLVKYVSSSICDDLIGNRQDEVGTLLDASQLNFSSIQSSTFLPITNWSKYLQSKGHKDFSQDITNLFSTIVELQKVCLVVRDFEKQLFSKYAVDYFEKQGANHVEVLEYLKNRSEKSFSSIIKDLIASKKCN